jgi:hypothetical protein
VAERMAHLLHDDDKIVDQISKRRTFPVDH